MPFWGKGGRGHLGRFPEQPFVPCQHRQPDPLRPTGCRLVGPCQQRQSVSISPAACSNHCRKKPFIVANKGDGTLVLPRREKKEKKKKEEEKERKRKKKREKEGRREEGRR